MVGTVGVGWIVWRGVDYLPKELIFELHYLGEVSDVFREYITIADDRPTTRSISTSLDLLIPSLVRCSIVSPFSVYHKPGHKLILVLNLGFEGYRRIMQNDLTKARLISRALENSGYYTVLSQIHKPKSSGAVDVLNSAAKLVKSGHSPFNEEDAEYYMEGLPVVSFRFTDDVRKKYPGVQQAWVQKQLRGIGWIVPK
jgi:glutamate decarboxylase